MYAEASQAIKGKGVASQKRAFYFTLANKKKAKF